ncbi:MAG: protein kinase, partial [Erysipelotrichaceae bacterium]|nr:protein kinase [Erysipelotrichaceae bacterium]
IPYKEAVWLIRQLAYALMEAHRHNIIHRDVKSQNVLIKNDGTVKVADFGIALANGEVDITSKDSVLGSVHYLAPELTKGTQATMQSDIYSLGIVFYELLTGNVPYNGENAIQIALQHVKGTIPSVRALDPSIPQSVENIIIKATAKSLENRYANIALMIKDLNECLKKEHANDPKIELDKELETKTMASFHIADTSDTEKKEKKKNDFDKRFTIIYITCITIIAGFLLIGVLYLSGIIGTSSTKTTVPDLSGLTIVEASDLLEKNYLQIDMSDIDRVMTDDIPSGKIIFSSPGTDTEVEKGSKIKITVSDGIFSRMPDFVGKDIEEVRSQLKGTNIYLQAVSTPSREQPGTVLEQAGIAAGERYNPNVSNTLILTYSEYPTMIIPFDILGRNVDDVAWEFSESGFRVEKHQQSLEAFTDDEKAKYGPGTVVRITPDMGSSYIQEEDSSIHLYYYQY